MKILRALTIGIGPLLLSIGLYAQEMASPATIEERLQALERFRTTLEGQDILTTLKISGYLQSDYRAFLADKSAFSDQFLIRRARLIVDATWNKLVNIRLQPDFSQSGSSGGTVSLQDAYAELMYIPGARIKTGKFTPPVGIERIQSSASLLLTELALTQNLVPNRDTGLQIAGDIGGGLSYQTGVFNGVVDGGVSETDNHSGKDFVGRIFYQPFKNKNSRLTRNMGVGVAGSIGDQMGTPSSSNLPTFRTDGQQVFFAYGANVYAHGSRKRLAPHGYWYAGPFGVLGEWVSSSQRVSKAAASTMSATMDNIAWQVATSLVLTGESPSYAGVIPKKTFSPSENSWGAFELTARYAELKVDEEAFDEGLADIASYAQRARTWTGGFNWYLNSHLKVTSNYAYTTFNGGESDHQNRRPERALLSRIQASF